MIYNGPTAGIAQADSRTGAVLYKDISPNDAPKAAASYFQIQNATANNLKNVSVKIPKGVLTCVTGVSGSGKSSLIHECFLPEHPEAVVIDQSPIGRSSRANPLTYTGIFDTIRKEFAAHTGANASRLPHSCRSKATSSSWTNPPRASTARTSTPSTG